MHSNLSERAGRIRLPVRQIARSTGHNIRSVERVLASDPNVRTGITDKVTAHLVAEERALLAHLKALHPEG